MLSCLYIAHLILSFVTAVWSLGRTEPLIQWVPMGISP
jgi:hypothetical protein